MIDNVTIVTKGGLVLWSHTTHPLTGNPVNALIRNVLLESRSSEKSYNYDKYVLKWSLENDLDLLFIITYQKMIPLLYVDELLALVKQQFLNNFKDVLSGAKKSSSSSSLSQQSSNNSSNGSSTTQTLSHYNFSEFTEEYKNILRAVEMRDRENRALKKQGAFQKQTVSERLRSEKQIQKEKEKKLARDQRRRTNNNNSEEEEEEENSDEDNDSDNSNSDSESPTTPTHQQTNNRDSLDAQSLSPSVRRSGSKREMKTFSKKDSPATGGNSSGSKPVKKATKWDDMKYTKAAADALNANKKNTSSEDDQVNAFMNRYMPDRNARTNIDDDDDDESSFNANDYKLQEKEEKKTGIFGSFFNNLANGKTIEKEELVPLMQKFKESLISKNVAAEIAEKICESVAEDLQGKKISAFTRLQSEVIRSLEETMTRILTPKRNIDMLRDIMAAREQNRPYVITFCGVNGVGKSTSLSKICFWLLQNNLKCLIAACDTFRSGAVEQLNVHAKCLNVPVYDRGYGKDISIVAKEAINEAKRKNYDVVLVDTAGRMQDNEPLMKSLTKLIYLNNPDMVLFVGEALVGNDGIDQLMKFNDALKNISMGENAAAAPARDLIDGIVLTKFDTIDDKVGAAISMVYKTGHPIVFVGVGQTYTDLKKLSIKSVVRSLLN